MDAQNKYFKGFACIELRHLSLDPMKHIEAHKISGATKSFEKFGCRHNKIEHSVPIIIDQTVLDIALSEAHVSPSALFNVGETCPRLRFPKMKNFAILYGDHRLRAAKDFLPADNRFWIVALFDSAISPVERAKVMQGNHCRHHAPDGQALATILGESSQEVVDIWLGNMSATRRRMFTRLKKVDDGRLSEKVQELLRFRGLQLGSSGNWEHILRMRCYEASPSFVLHRGPALTAQQETYSYLDAILNTWKYIIGDDITSDQLDESTVVALHLKFPAYSSHDCETIKDLFLQNKVFPFVGDLRVRENIAGRLLNCRRIVTFRSFFEDFIYIGACLDGLTTLLPEQWKHGRESFQTAMRHNWKSDQIQPNDHPNPKPTNFLECYVDLWLSAQREFPSLSVGKSSNLLKDKSPVDMNGGRDHIQKKGVQLAYRAYNHGFETSRIEEIMQKHPFEIPQDGPEKGKPDISTHECALILKARSNRPHKNDYYRNKPFLHPIHVFDTTRVERKTHATTFAVARDIVHCCWNSAACVERWVHQPPLGAPNMMNTELTPFVQKPRITLHFRESGSQRGKGGGTGIRRSNPDPEYYRQLIQQAPNPFCGTDDNQMSNSFPVTQQMDYEGEETCQTDNATAHEGARDNSSFDVADAAATRMLPVQSGIKDASHFDDTLNVFHGDITNGSTAERCDQNDETGTTDRESLTVAPLQWQVRHGLALSQAPSPSEYSDAWTDEVTEAEEHIKSGLDLFEDGSVHRKKFVGDTSTGSGEMPQYVTDNRAITKHDFKPGITISPNTTSSRKRIPDVDANTKISVERLSPKVEGSELQESDSSADSTLPDPEEDRRDENANRGLGSKSKNLDDDNTLNFERDRGVAIKGRRMTEVPDGLGIFPEGSNEREHDADRKRKRGAEEEWKFKSARRAGEFRPRALLLSRVGQHGT